MSGYKKQSKKIFWGFILIAAAVLIVLDAIGIVPDVPFVKLALGALCLSWAVRELFSLKIHGIVLPSAFIFMLFEREIGLHFGLGENIISNWLVLLAALLLSGGLGMIFGGLRRGKTFGHGKFGHRIGDKVNNNRFSVGSVYIDCADFKHEVIKNSFGGCEVYFNNTDAYEGGGVLEIENSFGAVEVHVPAEFNVLDGITTEFASVEIEGKCNPDGKTLTIKGHTKFGAVEIYVG